MDVLIGEKGSAKTVRVEALAVVGKGGEADVFDLGNGHALKLYKPPDHPDYATKPIEQRGARERIAEQQQKLLAFPKGLPKNAVAPAMIARDPKTTMVVGYTLPLIVPSVPLLHFGQRWFREGAVSDQRVLVILKRLHALLLGIHQAKVVVGDLNDNNVLVRRGEPFLIDLDSAQFGTFLSRAYTRTFVDPLLCKKNARVPELVRPHNELSDWYAFAIMVMQSLLFTGPYLGTYTPADQKKRIVHDARPLHRITVFHPEVRYPKPARPLNVLPDSVLAYLEGIFVRDVREPFSLPLLEKLQFDGEGNLLATLKEPLAPARVKEVVMGNVTATKLFSTSGIVLFATVQRGELRYLYHEHGMYRREGGVEVIPGALDKQMRFRIQGTKSLLAKENVAIILSPDGKKEHLQVDTYGKLPLVDANGTAVFFVAGGVLKRVSSLGIAYEERIGDVLAHQTLFWVGEEHGFGFYRAGKLTRYFLFHANGSVLQDSVVLPPMQGQLLDATCLFGAGQTWFFVSVREGARTVNRCFVLNQTGVVIAEGEATLGDGSWLGGLRGKCVVRNMLLVATDDGIVRVEADGARLAVTKEFSNTARFVDSESHLFPGKGGLWVVKSKEIWKLQIA